MNLFDLSGKVAIVTGGTGVLGSAIACGLAAAGAKVGVLGRRSKKASEVAEAIASTGGEALPLIADVLDREQLESARNRVIAAWGRIDVLVNAAGGNMPEATVAGELTFFKAKPEALETVLKLNLLGSVFSSQIFGEVMAEQKQGSIINISSMTAQRPLTHVIGYSAAKAAIDNFTRWLAVELAHRHGPSLRVNAIAPGFFIGEQNHDLLLDASGELTARGRQIIAHTPMGRFGKPDELIGTVVWLASEASHFVTGVVVPVDGGFSAFAGV